jgi:hypothetical protein
MAAQAGWFGVIGFVSWLGAIARKAMKAWRAAGWNRSDGRALGALATIAAFAAHSMVDYLNVLSIGLQFALALAIGVAGIPPENEAMTEGTETH